ncbi:MAG TPA: hypothetical protein VHC96_00390 [Puia sp.]|nr:hypothetical protein [Puia sp.]
MKIHRNKTLAGLGLILLLSAGCAEAIEKDLTDKRATLLLPSNNAVLDTTTLTFAWQPQDDALKYELQVVSPSFDSALVVWADTNVINTSFQLTLTGGRYQWRVRAFNNTSSTPFSDPWGLVIH